MKKMSEEDKTIHHGWLELYTESSSGAWSKLSGKRQWKRKFIVLNQSASNEEECYLLTFDKEELWRVATPKKRLSLYPRYKISKLSDFKGREKVLEINNESNQWYVTSSKSKIVNLWALQIQMQTKLSRAISGRIFSVVGIDNKDMQSIGAASQNCLLHFTKWGITLALQKSRAILAMWPLKTIRNYEDSGHSEFTIEAGRRAPMGEGLYRFQTNVGIDREMFNVVDAFVAALLDEKACIEGGRKPTTDDEILRTYDQLYKTAIGENHAKQRPRPLNKDMMDAPGYSHIGTGVNSSGRAAATTKGDISNVSYIRPPDYNHLYNDGVDFTRVDIDEKKYSLSSSGGEPSSPRGLSFSDNQTYDKLGGALGNRHPSWGAASSVGKGEYAHINSDTIGRRRKVEDAYDQVDRSGVSFKKKATGSWGIAGYPLRDEPSVPCLDDYDHSSFKRRSPIQQTPENEKGYIFRNSIYSMSPSGDNSSTQQQQQGLGGRHDSTASEGGRPYNNGASQGFDSRHGSTASGSGRSFRRGISIKEKSHQDIADHFMYQVPSSLNSTADQEEFYQNATTTTTMTTPTTSFSAEGEIYQNTASQPTTDIPGGGGDDTQHDNASGITSTLKGTTIS